MFSPFNLSKLPVLGRRVNTSDSVPLSFLYVAPQLKSAQGRIMLPSPSCYNNTVAKIAGTLQESE